MVPFGDDVLVLNSFGAVGVEQKRAAPKVSLNKKQPYLIPFEPVSFRRLPKAQFQDIPRDVDSLSEFDPLGEGKVYFVKEKAVGCANAGIHFVRLVVQEILILFKLGIVSKLVLQEGCRSAFLPFSDLDWSGQSWVLFAFFCCPGVMYSYQVLIYDVLYYIASLQK